MFDVSIPAAFGAGMLSFLSPCVLPLIPTYISFVSGVSVLEIVGKIKSPGYYARILSGGLLFSVGFSTVFVILGLGATGITRLFSGNREIMLQIAGVFILLFGLATIGLGRGYQFSFLGRFGGSGGIIGKWRLVGPIIFGMAFALAWTPCVGPILGTILTIAAIGENYGRAVTLLVTYALGITIPFIIISLGVGSVYGRIKKMEKIFSLAHFITGVALIIVGVVMISGKLNDLTGFFVTNFYQMPFYQQLLDRI